MDHQKEEAKRVRAMRYLSHADQVWHLIAENTIEYEPGPFWRVADDGYTIWEAKDLEGPDHV